MPVRVPPGKYHQDLRRNRQSRFESLCRLIDPRSRIRLLRPIARQAGTNCGRFISLTRAAQNFSQKAAELRNLRSYLLLPGRPPVTRGLHYGPSERVSPKSLSASARVCATGALLFCSASRSLAIRRESVSSSAACASLSPGLGITGFRLRVVSSPRLCHS